MNQMNTRQLKLGGIDIHQDARITDFLGDSWIPVINAVRQLQTGLLKFFYIHGAQGTGKSHLLSAICASYMDMKKRAIKISLKDLVHDVPTDILSALEMYDLIAIDDLQVIIGHKEWEEAIFHLYNRGLAGDCQLIFTSNVAISALTFELKDLKSRIAQSPSFLLPADHLLEEKSVILQGLLTRRNIKLPKSCQHELIYHGPTKTSLMSALLDEFLAKMKATSHLKMSATDKKMLQSLCEKYQKLS